MTDPAAALVALCKAQNITIATAESCTGGLIAAAITAIPGSSAVLDRGFVTYSNQAKSDLLGVPENLITTDGAVSKSVAQAMAAGARHRAGTTLAVSVTGIAGPDGGSPEKPVGTIWFGLATPTGAIETHNKLFSGDRAAIRAAAVTFALNLLLGAAKK
jgi:nicotinamide-nucleotide amidase